MLSINNDVCVKGLPASEYHIIVDIMSIAVFLCYYGCYE